MINASLAPSLLYSAPWYVIVLALLAAAAALGAAIWLSAFLIRRIEKVTWRRPVAVRFLRIRNTGNVPGVFQLIASAGDDLAFKYLLDGQPLPLRYVPLPPPARPAPAASSQPAASAPVAAAQPADEAGPTNKPGSTQAAVAGAKKLENDAKKALGKGRVLISIVGTLGSLIPGAWGKSLKDRSTALQADAQKAGAAIELPSQKIQTVKSLQSQTQSLVPGTKPALPVPAAATQAVPQPAPAAEAVSPAVVPENVRPASPFSSYVQTPTVAPEGEVVVELHIEPQERFRTAEWCYWLTSRQVEQEAVPPANALSPQRVRQSVRIKGLPVGYLLLTFLLDTGVICLNVGWVVLFIDWLTRLIA